jgi:hypothetical protein
MTKHFLMVSQYPEGSALRTSDQITVPRHLWTKLDQDHVGHGPIFVQMGTLLDLDTYETGAVGRLTPSTEEYGTSCQVPDWMWAALDAVEGWIEVRELPDAGTIVLRAEREATVTSSVDPVAMLTDALTGVTGTPWACLCVGMRLPLSCGVFDVMEIQSVEGFPVSAAAILDVDVNLEFAPALDHVRRPTASSGVGSQPHTPIPAEPEIIEPMIPVAPAGKFVPFSGVGRRLGS